MTEVKQAPEPQAKAEEPVVHKAQEFWFKNSKIITYILGGLVLLVAGYFVYDNYFRGPQEQKAAEAMYKAEEFYRMDSVRLALNGSGASQGFLRIISKYGGTDAGNLARFYAGSSYMKLGDFKNAIKHLEEFSTGDDLLQVRKLGLLGDAHAELGQRKEALDYYEKAGTLHEEDNINSPEYLFRAGLLSSEMGNEQKAIEMFKIIKQKYPTSRQGAEIDKYLARLGVFE